MVLIAMLSAAINKPAVAASEPSQEAWSASNLPGLEQTAMRSAAGLPYRIFVAAPSAPPPKGGYPVFYVVDGNAWTVLVSEIIRTNLRWGVQSEVQPAVIVGVGYPIDDDAFDMDRRTLDLTPTAAPDYPGIAMLGGTAAGGDVALMDFIDTVVKPSIEKRFAIDRGRQTLIGHSLGGLFTLRTLFTRPESFQTYVAISSSIWWNERSVMTDARRFAARPDRPAGLRVFLAAGDLEQYPTPAYVARMAEFRKRREGASEQSPGDVEKAARESREAHVKFQMVEASRQMGELLSGGGISTEFVEFPDEDHFSVLPSALGRAVPFALRK